MILLKQGALSVYTFVLLYCVDYIFGALIWITVKNITIDNQYLRSSGSDIHIAQDFSSGIKGPSIDSSINKMDLGTKVAFLLTVLENERHGATVCCNSIMKRAFTSL